MCGFWPPKFPSIYKQLPKEYQHKSFKVLLRPGTWSQSEAIWFCDGVLPYYYYFYHIGTEAGLLQRNDQFQASSRQLRVAFGGALLGLSLMGRLTNVYKWLCSQPKRTFLIGSEFQICGECIISTWIKTEIPKQGEILKLSWEHKCRNYSTSLFLTTNGHYKFLSLT